MQKKFVSTKNMVVCAVSVLMLLPGCGSEKKVSAVKAVSDGSAAMLTIDGTTLITEKSFKADFDQLVASNTNPQFQMMLQLLPNAKEEIFKGKANEKILCYWADKEGVVASKEYQEKYEQGLNVLRVGLAAEFFQKEFAEDLKVTEGEMHAYYEAHKDPELLIAPAGIKIVAAEFASQEQAQALYVQAKQSPKNFKAIAGSKAKDYVVNDYSIEVDKAVKEQVAAISSFPTVLQITATTGKIWVVVVTGREEAKYHPYEQVKQGLEQMVQRDKMAKFYIEKLNGLRQKYNVVENTVTLGAVSSAQEEQAEEALVEALAEQDAQEGLDASAQMSVDDMQQLVDDSQDDLSAQN